MMLLIVSYDGPHCWRQWRYECPCGGAWGRR
jgi:hypothetical protein